MNSPERLQILQAVDGEDTAENANDNQEVQSNPKALAQPTQQKLITAYSASQEQPAQGTQEALKEQKTTYPATNEEQELSSGSQGERPTYLSVAKRAISPGKEVGGSNDQ